ncbi:hypothetical protein BU16DRAFT_297287 [Lophium mytilinum]|uniref:Uncharacterized protein n=1 Tax=Lophium mytilinum TaxID=390894 RepID=A0A6A6R2L3_9PEZI|nr:hypothetical protein BU16DRAFT_297287 [Lophium mytilinum]
MGQTNHSGLIAIIVKQTLPFEFMKLPKNVRERVYNHILCDEGKTIRVKTRGGTHKSSFAPAFTSLNRLAILSLNRQVREEALPILFNQKFIMETTYSLQNFLLQIDVGRKYITKIIVEMYERKTAQPAFQLLINCKQLKKLRFDHVSSNSQVPQALKVIWSDAGTWLTSFNNPGPYRKDAAAVMEILSFGSNSFHSKVMDKKTGELNVKKWGYLEHGTLIAGLKKKLTEANRRTDLEIARR